MVNSPLGDPVVTIGDKSYSLKFSLLCQYIADRRGVDLEHLIPMIPNPEPGEGKPAMVVKPGPGKLALILDLFAAMVAHNFVESQRPVPTAEEWALQLPEDSIPAISKAVIGALGKRLGLAQRPLAAPETEQAPQLQ
jgi:hypothetical protein